MTRLLPMPDTTIHVPVLTEQAGNFSWEPHSEATSNQNSMGEILPEPPPNFLLLSVQSYRKCFNQGFLDCLVLSEEWRRKVESNSSSSCCSRLRDVSVIFFFFFSLDSLFIWFQSDFVQNAENVSTVMLLKKINLPSVRNCSFNQSK